MKHRFAMGLCMAAALSLGAVAFAQSTTQAPPPTQAPAAAAQPQDHKAMEHVTVTGCVQKEADYRAAHNLGKGGAAGTGVGVDNEYVLVNVSITPDPSKGAAAATPAPTGTTGVPPAAYELTGENEGQVGQFVGRRVQIVGMLKRAEVGPGGATGGTTAGTPPTGVDVASKDLRLRELEVTTVTETTGTCTPGAAK